MNHKAFKSLVLGDLIAIIWPEASESRNVKLSQSIPNKLIETQRVDIGFYNGIYKDSSREYIVLTKNIMNDTVLRIPLSGEERWFYIGMERDKRMDYVKRLKVRIAKEPIPASDGFISLIQQRVYEVSDIFKKDVKVRGVWKTVIICPFCGSFIGAVNDVPCCYSCGLFFNLMNGEYSVLADAGEGVMLTLREDIQNAINLEDENNIPFLRRFGVRIAHVKDKIVKRPKTVVKELELPQPFFNDALTTAFKILQRYLPCDVFGPLWYPGTRIFLDEVEVYACIVAQRLYLSRINDLERNIEDEVHEMIEGYMKEEIDMLHNLIHNQLIDIINKLIEQLPTQDKSIVREITSPTKMDTLQITLYDRWEKIVDRFTSIISPMIVKMTKDEMGVRRWREAGKKAKAAKSSVKEIYFENNRIKSFKI